MRLDRDGGRGFSCGVDTGVRFNDILAVWVREETRNEDKDKGSQAATPG